MNKLLKKVRAWWYKRGYRPKPGTLLYSPSLELFYFGQLLIEAMNDGIKQARRMTCTCPRPRQFPASWDHWHRPDCPLSDGPPR